MKEFILNIENVDQKVNTENLFLGQIIRNYKEMCNLLNQNITDGNSKKAQIKEWNRYFNFQKQGQRFIINEIYEIPLPKRANSNAIYVKIIELLLMRELSMKKNFTCNYTKTNLFHLLGMVNFNYINKDKSDIRQDIQKYEHWQVNHFYNRSNQKLTEILFSALNSMERRCLLSYSSHMAICEDNIVRIASDREVQEIMDIKKKVLEEMNLTSVPFSFNKLNEFYKRTNEKIFDEFGWQYTYKEFKLIYNQQFMKKDIAVVENEIKKELLKQKIQLNYDIIEAVNKQAQYFYDKNLNDYEDECQYILERLDTFGKPDIQNKGIKLFKYPVEYLDNQIELANLFLRIQ